MNAVAHALMRAASRFISTHGSFRILGFFSNQPCVGLRADAARMSACATLLLASASLLHATTFYVTVAGLGGEPEYEQRFSGWAKDIDKALKTAPDAKVETLYGEAATKAAIRAALERIAKEAKPNDALVLMLIGHGSYDGSDYKFNIPGPDVTAIELATLLDRVPASRQLVVNMTSASGGAIKALNKSNRVIVSATKTGT